MKKRLLGVLLCLCMVFGLLPTTALAEELDQPHDSGVTIGESGICDHHQEHTGECGYNDAEGTACRYSCELCAEQESEPQGDSDPSQPAPETDEKVEAVRTLITALPDVEELEEMTTDEQRALYEGYLMAADEAYQALTDEQKAQLAAENQKLDELFGFFSAPVMMLNNTALAADYADDGYGTIVRVAETTIWKSDTGNTVTYWTCNNNTLTSANAEDNWNVKYDPTGTTPTLTLNGFSYTGAKNGVRSSVALKIVLQGTNTIKNNKSVSNDDARYNENHCIFVKDDLTITGTDGATLTVESQNGNGIMACHPALSGNDRHTESIIIESANITASESGDVGIVASQSLTIKDSTINSTGKNHGLQGGNFTSDRDANISISNSTITAKATANDGKAFQSAPTISGTYQWRGSDTGSWTDSSASTPNFSQTYLELKPGSAASAEHASHPICGASCSHSSDTHSDVTWTGVSTLTDSMTAGNYYLTDNVTLTDSWKPADGVVLCLNGKTVTFGGYGANVNDDAIELSRKSSLILCDCVGDGKIQLGTKGTDSQLSGIYVGEGCGLMMYGGTIRGFNKSGVHVGGTNATSGVFYMYGGNITENAASDTGSGGVRVDSAANFDMYGGCISGNTGGFFGGGVYNSGNFRMHGGEIKGNTVTGTSDSSILAGGGGVYNDSSGVFEMSGGCISGNTVIKGNADRCGSGVFCALNMELSGSPVIKGNTRTAGGNETVDDNLLLLAYDSKITIDGTLKNNAQIGVNVRNGIPEAGKPRTITNVSNADYSACFFSDASYWTIAGGMSDAGQVVQLAVPAAHVHEWQYALEENTQDSIVAYCSTSGDCEFGRNGGTLTIEAPENLVYDGQAKPAKLVASDYWERVTGTSGISISYGKYYNTAWNTMDGVPTEAGRYLASIKVGNVTAFVSYDITDASSGKADPTYTAPTAKNGLTYNGQPQELINAGSATGGEMQYKLTGEGAYSASIPKATDAGVYTVFYKVVGNDGYNDVAEQSMTAYIGMAVLRGTPTFTPITGAGRTLADVELTAPADWPAGTFQWLNGDAVLANDTPITQGTSYYWKFVPDAAYNYYSLGQYIVLWAGDGGGGSEHTHSYGADWMTDSTGHWHECSCGDKKDFAAHTPGAAATETTPQTCTVCGYVIKPATGGSTGGGSDYIPPSGGSSDGGDSGTPGEEIPTSPETGGTTPAYVTYTVQKGDTLWAISRKYGCTVADIVAANSGLIKNPNLILVGWQLQIPQGGKAGTGTPDAALPEDKETGVYIVKRGDTLWAISRKYGCTVAAIVALNGELIDDPDLIFAGWELKIPQG